MSNYDIKLYISLRCKAKILFLGSSCINTLISKMYYLIDIFEIAWFERSPFDFDNTFEINTPKSSPNKRNLSYEFLTYILFITSTSSDKLLPDLNTQLQKLVFHVFINWKAQPKISKSTRSNILTILSIQSLTDWQTEDHKKYSQTFENMISRTSNCHSYRIIPPN